MAYRRRVGVTRGSTFKEEDVYNQTTSPSSPSPSPSPSVYYEEEEEEDDEDDDHNHKPKTPTSFSNSNVNVSLAARAIKASSAAHRDYSGYGSAYSPSPAATSNPPSSPLRYSDHLRPLSFSKGSSSSSSSIHSETSPMKDSRYGLWGVIARKAKSILEEDNHSQSKAKSILEQDNYSQSSPSSPSTNHQSFQSRQSSHTAAAATTDNARLRKRLDVITPSINNFGDSLGNAIEEGRTIMEQKTADIIQETRNKTVDFIQETRKLQLRRRGANSNSPDQATVVHNTSWQRPVLQPVQINPLANQETQLKASRDVAMATAAKAKVLLRELKTVKADLAFAKERSAQLEEENKRLRESQEKGDNPADDDLIRLQLETLLAEKARLAHENSIYARENRFLREIVEYHQLTTQEVVYLDEGSEEVTEVYPFSIDDAKGLSITPTSPISLSFLPEVSSLSIPEIKEYTREVPNEVFNITSSTSSPSSHSTLCPTTGLPEGKESLEIQGSSQLVTDGESDTSFYSEPQDAAGEAPK